LYGCETWSLTLREEHRWIFWPKREEVTGDWRRLHNEGLHNLYISPHIIRVISHIKEDGVGRVCFMYGRAEKCIQYLDWKTWRGYTTQKS
jgi:uncharacterized protein YbdZ (MbtH family)